MNEFRNGRKRMVKQIRWQDMDLQHIKRYLPWLKDANELEYFRALNARKEEKVSAFVNVENKEGGKEEEKEMSHLCS